MTHDEQENIKSQLFALLDKANASAQEIEKHKTEIANIASQLSQQTETTKANREYIQNTINDVQQKKNEVMEYHHSIESLFKETNTKSTEIIQLQQNFQKQSEDYDKLREKIEGLLPGAAAAGLASRFNKAVQENDKTGFLWLGFYASLLGLFLMYLFLFIIDINNLLGWINAFINGNSFTWHAVITNGNSVKWDAVLTRIPLGLPFLWIAWFCQKSITDKKKIREEYHHKEQIINLYTGFVKQIQELENINSEEMKKLITLVMEAVALNPANRIGTNKTPIEQINLMSKKTKDKQEE